MPTPIRILLPLALLAALAGCAASNVAESKQTLDVTGPIAIEVDSFGGDVFITGTDGADRATVRLERVGLHGSGRAKEAAASLDQIDTSVEIVPGDLGQVLSIRATTTHAEPHYQRVHVHIEAPLIDGVRVFTRRGRVYVQNIAGNVDIETTDGNVRVMTEQPMTRAVTIINRDGDIDYRVRGESRAAFDCEARDGSVATRVRLGTLNVFGDTDHDTLQAVLNEGDNPVVLRTVNGAIRIAVVENPEAIGVFIFDP